MFHMQLLLPLCSAMFCVSDSASPEEAQRAPGRQQQKEHDRIPFAGIWQINGKAESEKLKKLPVAQRT